MAQKPLLEIQSGKHKGRKIRITDLETIIGRGDDAKIRISSKDVSRHHCILIATSAGILVKDLGSSNGTFVNGRPVENEVLLQSGGTLAIGPMIFKLLGTNIPADTPEDVKITIQSPAQLADSLSDAEIASWLIENDPSSGVESDTAIYELPNATPKTEELAAKAPVPQTPRQRKKEFRSVSEEAADIIRRHQQSQQQ